MFEAQFSRIVFFKYFRGTIFTDWFFQIFSRHTIFTDWFFQIFSRHTIFTDCFFQIFSRHTIFTDWFFQKFSRHNFHGLFFSKIFVKTIFADHGSVSASIRYFNISRSLIFEVRCQSVKNAKIMTLEKFLPYCSFFSVQIDCSPFPTFSVNY